MRNIMKITARKEEATPALLPKLRFPEFRKAQGWTGVKLGSKTNKVGSGITPTGGDKNYKLSGRPFVRSQNIGWGVLLLDDVAFIGEETHNSFSSTQIEVFDVLLNITGASIGRSAVADARIKGGNVNQHVCIIRVKPEELSPYFLNQYLISYDGQKQIDSFQAGGNRQGLNFEQIRSFLIPLPAAFPEQQKIAEFLSSLDELIAAQARKVDALKTHKKGLMQQLFPREGETQPRLRFPEFQNEGEWKPQCLSGLIDLISGMHLSPDDYSTVGEVPYFTGPSDFANDLSTVTKWTKRTANVSQAEDTLITVKGSGVGEIWYTTLPEVAMGRQLMAVRSKNGSSRFMFQFLLTKRSRFEDLGSGNLIPGLSRAVILELEACFPSPAEQQRIATCLTTIDALITAEIQKHEALKIHKKGLMQQLFPSSEEYEP